MSDVPIDPPPIKQAMQFRLSAIFVLTLVASLLAAFVQPYGNDMMLAALATTLVCTAFALLVGSISPPMMDRVFWGIVVAAMMQVVAATVILFDRLGIYAWPIAAGVGGVFAASYANRYARMLMSGASAGTIIAVYMGMIGIDHEVILANVFCAMIGGALLALMVEFVRWVESKRRIPQPMIGLALVVSAMGFSLVASRIIPGW